MRAWRLVLAFFVLVIPALPASTQAGTLPPESAFAFMAGDWMCEKGTTRIEEHWMAPAGSLMVGMGRTVADGKAVSFEFLRIEFRPTQVVYVASPNGEGVTEFVLTKMEDGAATFENPGHDNPKKIRYERKADGWLVARTEGEEGGKKVADTFAYRRIGAK